MPEAVAAAKKATELDPLSAWAWVSLSLQLGENEQFAEAHESLRRLMMILPEAEFPLSWLGIVQLREGKATEALATFRSISEEGLRVSGIIMAEHTLGHAKESQQALDQVIAKHGQPVGYSCAEIYAWRGEKDKAFECLGQAYQQHDTNMSDFRNDATLVSLHGDPRFAALLRRMNLPE
jgi:Flp pilus assembly protein TadD